MFPKKGRKLPVWQGVLGERDSFAKTLADLLRKQPGEVTGGSKQLIRQTNVSERTANNSLSAQHAPQTLFFLRLVVSSPVIHAFVWA